jgi:amidase
MSGATTRDGGVELWRLDATALADRIRARDVSSREVLDSSLQRIAEVNPQVNAITRMLTDGALLAAERADRELALGRQPGPLHGVPVSVKENVDVEGSPTTHGVRAPAHTLPSHDAPHIRLLRRAGAIVLARTNLSEYASRWHTDNALHGPTLNPWEPAVTAGGSSGGEAVAIATGMSPLGFGNDDGGSLRYPAQCVGICSLKPSRGRMVAAVSEESDPRLREVHRLLNVEGPLARSVRDLRLALRVIGRPGRPPGAGSASASALFDAGRGTIAIVPLDGVQPQVAEGVTRARACIEACGYDVVVKEPPEVDAVAETAARIALWAAQQRWPQLSRELSDDGRRHMELMFDLIGSVSDEAYRQALAKRSRINRRWTQFLQHHPIIVGPVSTRPPFPVGTDLHPEGLRSIVASMTLVTAVNLIGLPAAVVPVGAAGGLPQAVQIISRRHREDLCLEIAEVLESTCGSLTPVDPHDGSQPLADRRA